MRDGEAGEPMQASCAIAVIIATRERPEALARCLDALYAGTLIPAETIVVDQSRDDRTRQLVDRRRGDGREIIYVHRARPGMSGAQNDAIVRARAPIVAVTDDDCVPDPSWLTTIDDAFRSCAGLGAITGRVVPLAPEGDRVFPVSSRPSTERVEFDGKAPPWLVGSGNNFAVKVDWFRRIGGCDERLGPGAPGRGGADMDLFYRLLRAGAVIRYEPAALVHHERQDRAGRAGRRIPYGMGMGACCTLYLLHGDRYGLVMLARWLGSRARLLGSGLARRDWTRVYEEALVLRGTVQGLVFGWRARASSQPLR